MMPLIKKRKDYKPLFWLPRETYIEILIYNDFTIVKSKIIFQKNKSDLIKNYKLKNTLELNGLDLITKKFLLIIDKLNTKSIEIFNFYEPILNPNRKLIRLVFIINCRLKVK